MYGSMGGTGSVVANTPSSGSIAASGPQSSAQSRQTRADTCQNDKGCRCPAFERTAVIVCTHRYLEVDDNHADKGEKAGGSRPSRREEERTSVILLPFTLFVLLCIVRFGYLSHSITVGVLISSDTVCRMKSRHS
jgi:hypothetical protein